MKKTIKGSKWFLILATVLCLVLLVISVCTFIRDRSAFSMVAIIIVLGVLLMNFIYFKKENTRVPDTIYPHLNSKNHVILNHVNI